MLANRRIWPTWQRVRITDNYTFTLNGEKIKNGHSISTEASWELKATPIGESEATKTITFTTSVSLANKLLPKNLTVSPEGLVEFAEALNDAGYSIWLAESGLSETVLCRRRQRFYEGAEDSRYLCPFCYQGG